MKGKMDNKGVTLVEVLISLVILLIVFMGLLQASLLSIDHNVRNSIRDEAVKIAADRITMDKSLPYANLTDTKGACEDLPPVSRTFRNRTQPFEICRLVKDMDASNKEVRIEVKYSFRNEPDVVHRVNAIISDPALRATWNKY